MKNIITIFTDGSSRGNPGPGGWGAVVVRHDRDTVTELGGREDHTTNNRMEIMAAIEALRHIEMEEVQKATHGMLIRINSDSSYLINGITKWVHGWAKKNWLTSQKEEVLNRDLWSRLVAVVAEIRQKTGAEISWNYVGGHAGVLGNERCDEIATSFADGEPVKLFSGPFVEYHISNILDISESAAASGSKSRSKAKAYSYISMVNGIIKIDKTWAQCEVRVKGMPGAKYKKAVSAEDEAEIVKTFGAKF